MLEFFEPFILLQEEFPISLDSLIFTRFSSVELQVERMKNFDFDDWRKKYMKWMNHNKSRIMDFFRKQDKDHDGKVTRMEFIDGILASSKFQIC